MPTDQDVAHRTTDAGHILTRHLRVASKGSVWGKGQGIEQFENRYGSSVKILQGGRGGSRH